MTQQENADTPHASQLPRQPGQIDKESEAMDAEDNMYDDDHSSLFTVTHWRWQEERLQIHGFYKDLPDIRCMLFLQASGPFWLMLCQYVVYLPPVQSEQPAVTTIEVLGQFFDDKTIWCVPCFSYALSV